MSEQTNGNGNGRKRAYRFSATIALILAALTIVELFVAVFMESSPLTTGLLLLMASAKAYLVVYYYMHISRLWKPEGEH